MIALQPVHGPCYTCYPSSRLLAACLICNSEHDCNSCQTTRASQTQQKSEIVFEPFLEQSHAIALLDLTSAKELQSRFDCNQAVSRIAALLKRELASSSKMGRYEHERLLIMRAIQYVSLPYRKTQATTFFRLNASIDMTCTFSSIFQFWPSNLSSFDGNTVMEKRGLLIKSSGLRPKSLLFPYKTEITPCHNWPPYLWPLLLYLSKSGRSQTFKTISLILKPFSKLSYDNTGMLSTINSRQIIFQSFLNLSPLKLMVGLINHFRGNHSSEK